MMVALAQVADLEDRLGVPLSDSADTTRAESALADASALVREEAGQQWEPSDVPDAVQAVVITAALRVIRNPTGVTSRTTGPFTEQYTSAAAVGVYLSDAEKAIVRRYRPPARRPVWTLPTTRNEEWETTQWLDDSYGLEPIPYDTR